MSKWMTMLNKHDKNAMHAAVDGWIAQSPSPGINYLFGKKQGMKAGYSMLLYGPAKSGKSLLSLAFAGQLHKNDPEAIVLHFDTEFRDTIDTWADSFGIDKKRIRSFQTNKPEDIFDFIANDVTAMLQDGAPIKMIIIDSLEMINYPKEANAELSTNAIMGDASSYLKRGMKMILPVIRQYKIANIMCQHVRMNMDPHTAKYRPFTIPGGTALRNTTEFWVLCEKINAKDSKVFDSGKKDGSGNPIQTGHAIRVKMEENSLGPQSRAVEIHLDYQRGLVDQHREIAELAVNMGAVDRPNNMSYVVGDKKWTGFENFCTAVKDDEDLQKTLLAKIKENDIT